MLRDRSFIISLIISFATLIGVGYSYSQSEEPDPPIVSDPAEAAPYDVGYVQVERVGRPGINSLLVVSNSYQNTFNSLPPALDLSATAAPIREEIIETLDFMTGLRRGGPTSEQVLTQFLPDVVRIKVDEANSRPGNPLNGDRFVGYISCLNTAITGPLLCGGRKLRDDVTDITLNYMASGSLTQPYRLTDNITHRSQHSLLSSSFPFLAPPN